MLKTPALRLALWCALPALTLMLLVACGGTGGTTPSVPATTSAITTPARASTPATVTTSAVPTAFVPPTAPPVVTSPLALTPPPVVTPALISTPPTASTAPAGASTDAVFTCPAGWTAQDVPARRYRFCTPPGWTISMASVAGSSATPVAGASVSPEPVGSLVHVFSPDQAGNLVAGAVAKGVLINIYITSVQVTAAFPNTTALPVCAGAAAAVGGHVTSLCNLDNTSSTTNPYRMTQWSSQPGNPTVYIQGFNGIDVSNSSQLLVPQLVGTIRFY